MSQLITSQPPAFRKVFPSLKTSVAIVIGCPRCHGIEGRPQQEGNQVDVHHAAHGKDHNGQRRNSHIMVAHCHCRGCGYKSKAVIALRREGSSIIAVFMGESQQATEDVVIGRTRRIIDRLRAWWYSKQWPDIINYTIAFK